MFYSTLFALTCILSHYFMEKVFHFLKLKPNILLLKIVKAHNPYVYCPHLFKQKFRFNLFLFEMNFIHKYYLFYFGEIFSKKISKKSVNRIFNCFTQFYTYNFHFFMLDKVLNSVVELPLVSTRLKVGKHF